jgi:hypothetical protein
MTAQIMADVIPIFITPITSLLHQNNIRITYARTSNFRMELLRSMPIYFVAMPQSVITVIEAPFVLTLIHIVDGVKFRPQIPRGT